MGQEAARPAEGRKFVWIPQPRQAQALGCPAFEVFFGGAKGGGKSDFLLGDYLQNTQTWGSAWRGVIFRRSYKELDELIERSHEIYGQLEGARYIGGDQRMWKIPAPEALYPGTATLRFRSLDKDSDVGKYNGHQYPWIGFDELTEFPTAGPYLFMINCCRSAKGAPCYMRSTGNPGRPGHPWVKPRFIDPAPPFHIYKWFPNKDRPDQYMTRCFIPSKLEDNRILMEKDPGYALRLESNPDERLRKALREGVWEIAIGQVFEKFTRERNVIPQPVLGREWAKWAALDWGFQKPFSIGWWAGNEDGRVVRYREWYGCEPGKENIGLRMPAKDVARKAWAMGLAEGVTTMIADPAIWSKQDDLPSVAEQFEEAGFEMIPANNDRINGLQAVHQLISQTGQDGKSYILITEGCTEWLRTVPYLTMDPRNPEDIDTTLEDHAYDETRYAIYSEIARNPKAYMRPNRMRAFGKAKRYDPLTHGLKSS